MMPPLIALALVFAQVMGPAAYTVANADNPEQIDLATQNGTLQIELEVGCEWVMPWLNVEYLPGSAGVAEIRDPSSGGLCSVYVSGRISDEPCAQNDLGDCDVAAIPT
jgi:hypothetical protein